MRNILAVLLPALLIACSSKEIDKSVLVYGKIENPTSDDFSVSNQSGNYSAPLDSSGNFELRFEIEKAEYYELRCGEWATMYISPGDSIYITLNTDQFDETLNYSGKGETANNYIIDKFLLNEKMEYETDYKKLYLSGEDKFKAHTDSMISILEDHLKQLISQNRGSLDKQFIKYEKIKLKYYKARLLTDFPKNYLNLTGNNIDLSEDYYNYLDDLELNDTSLLSLYDYNRFLDSYIQLKITAETTDTSASSFERVYEVSQEIIIETFENEKIRNKFLYNNMMSKINIRGIDNIDNILTIFKEKCSHNEYINEVDEILKSMQHLKAGNPAPVFEYADMKGDMISSADFKGNYIYIDVWSTSCGSCLRQMPYLIELEEEFRNKNIIFIGISLDNEYDKWRNMVVNKELKGIQLRADNGWKSQIVKDYKIRSIPTFILIDRQQNILDARALRPSEKISDILNNLESI